MIQHVYIRSKLSGLLDEVWIATCDRVIADAAESFGAPSIMTSDVHVRATDRVAEAALEIKADVYVMIQGDEPMIVPEMVTAAVEPMLQDQAVVCTNLMSPIRSIDEFESPNTIKVVTDAASNALYFSREPIPTKRQLSFPRIQAHKQVCIIPFRRDFLKVFAALKPTDLEQAESIDMLRALEHGYKVRMVLSDHPTQSVDTPEDLTYVERMMEGDEITKQYERI